MSDMKDIIASLEEGLSHGTSAIQFNRKTAERILADLRDRADVAARLAKAKAAYEDDPVDARDRPSSWGKLQELLDAVGAAIGEENG